MRAAAQAAAQKVAPHRIGDGDFTEVPERLRCLLAELVGGAPEQIVLGNSTSYGLHLIANGLPWHDGDEVLVIEGDYPATILPWQRLAGQGVRVRALRPAGLDQMRDTTVRDDLGARAFDVFCPASFATTLPWIASLQVLLGARIGTIAAWDQQLVDRLLTGIDPGQYRLISPAGGPERSTLVVLSRTDGTAAQRHRQLTEAGVDTAYREGNLRLSVHMFNTPAHIDRALDALHTPP